MSERLLQIRKEIARCHGNITSPADDDILQILLHMCEWMEVLEGGLGLVGVSTQLPAQESQAPKGDGK